MCLTVRGVVLTDFKKAALRRETSLMSEIGEEAAGRSAGRELRPPRLPHQLRGDDLGDELEREEGDAAGRPLRCCVSGRGKGVSQYSLGGQSSVFVNLTTSISP